MATSTAAAKPSLRAFRRVAILLGILAGVALVLAGAWRLVNLAARDTQVVRRTYPGVRALHIEAKAGGIGLRSAPAGAGVTVEEHVTRGLKAPKLEDGQAGGRLRLRSDCRGWLVTQCGVRYVVSVPAGPPVFAESDADDVRARALTSRAPLHLMTGSGEVVARGVSAPALRLESGTGGIGASDLRVPVVRAQNGSGSIALELRDPPREVIADTGSGDIVLSLPDRPYALTAATGSGHVIDGGVHRDTTSPHTVTARSGSGDVMSPRPATEPPPAGHGPR